MEWFQSYLFERKQCVTINGQRSTYRTLYAGVPQGSILGPLLFLIFINDITPNILTEIFMFADDTFWFETIDSNIDTSFNKLNTDLERLCTWAKQWLVKFNPQKTEYMKISRKHSSDNGPILYMDKPLGVISELKSLLISLVIL